MISRLTVVTLTTLVLAGAAAPHPSEKPAKAASGAPPKWKDLFDGKTMEGWKSSEFPGSGKVFVKDGAVIMEKGDPMTGVTYQRGDFPKMDYEVSLEGKKLTGDDFFCTTTFPVGEDFCSLVVGGWGGTIIGLSSLNGQDASMNDTTKTMEFARDRWYQVRIRVTRDRIQAWIDKEQVVNAETADRMISIRGECRRCRPFGVATYHTAGAIRNVRVRLLADAEKKPAENK